MWPQNSIEWLAVAGLGLLPLGAAFYTWDYGLKHGDITWFLARRPTPRLLSTLVLLSFGYAEFHWSIAVACLLISAGAAIAAKDMIFRKS